MMKIVDPTAIYKTDFHTIVARFGRTGDPQLFAGILRHILWDDPRSESRFTIRIAKTINGTDCVTVADQDRNKVFVIIPGMMLGVLLSVHGEIVSLEADPSSPEFVILPELDA